MSSGHMQGDVGKGSPMSAWSLPASPSQTWRVSSWPFGGSQRDGCLSTNQKIQPPVDSWSPWGHFSSLNGVCGFPSLNNNSNYALNALDIIPDTILNCLHAVTHVKFSQLHEGRSCIILFIFSFSDEDAEVEKGETACQRSQLIIRRVRI